MSTPALWALPAILGTLVLAGTALGRRRLGGRRTLRLALLWVGIIAATWLAVAIGLHTR